MELNLELSLESNIASILNVKLNLKLVLTFDNLTFLLTSHTKYQILARHDDQIVSNFR